MELSPSTFLPQKAVHLHSHHSWECKVSAKAGVTFVCCSVPGVTSACCPVLSGNVLGYGHRVPHLRVSDTQAGLCSQQGHSPLGRGLNLLFPHHPQATCSPLIFLKPAWDPALPTALQTPQRRDRPPAWAQQACARMRRIRPGKHGLQTSQC